MVPKFPAGLVLFVGKSALISDILRALFTHRSILQTMTAHLMTRTKACILALFSLLTLGFGVGTVPMTAAAQTAVPQVLDVRVGLHGARTRVVLDLDRAVKFDVFTLPEPYRVVLNLPEVAWKLNPGTLPENKGMLSRLRYGLFSPGTARMVFDVKSPIIVEKSFLLRPVDGKRWRLVLDLASTSETAFLEALAKKREQDRSKLKALVASTVVVPPQSNPLAIVPPRRPTVPGKRIIAIDPGHGGVDPGTIGIGKTYEKIVTLALGRDIRKALEATGRYKVVMTRDRDIFLRLRDRVQVARDAGAELFISVHADSVGNAKTRGLSVYTLSEKASDKEAAKLAAKENKADLIAGIDLTAESTDVTNILLDLAQRETMNQSALFAKEVVNELKREVKLLRNTHVSRALPSSKRRTCLLY